MERIDFLKQGAFCVKRMSLKAQRELLSLAESGSPFSESVLSELREIEKGIAFIETCGGRLHLSDFMEILTYCDQPTIDRIIAENRHKECFLRSKEIQGHFVLENAAIYCSNNMDASLQWFRSVLGWPGAVEARDESGNGVYGLIEPHQKANTLGNRSPYLQLMRGEPSKSVAAFIKVWGLSNIRQMAISNGWTQMTSIRRQPWGVDLFELITGDGSILRFYEPSVLGY